MSEFKTYEDPAETEESETLNESYEIPEPEVQSQTDAETLAPVKEKAELSVTDASADTGQANWYVVHTYSGHENKVKANIEKIVENRNMQDLIVNIVVPTEETIEVKNGQRKLKTRKIFPGYVIVKMVMTDESWYLVRNTQGVTGFVGHGSKPIPLTADEVRKMGIERIRVEIDVDEGDMVRVISGPFESFIGTVEEVNMEKQTLKAKISMFGRETPVELEFMQIEKLS